MSLPDQTPKLPKLPFLLGDAALLGAAWLIANHTRGPLSGQAILGIVACVAVGAILGAIPFLTDYARKQDEALDERQRGLEALSRTVNTAAEQISIAANGLHEIADLAHKNLKHAEQLPQKLHEKIAEFTAQLDNAREDDREELEKELAELRAAESERLEAVADKVQKAVADLGKLDTAAQKHLTARSEFLQKTSDAITQSHTDATVALNDASAAVVRELAAAQTKAVAEIDSKLTERTAAALAAIEAATAAARAAIAALPPPPPAPLAPEIAPADPAPAPATIETPPAPAEPVAPPKRPRKTRREEPAAAPTEPTLPPGAALEPAAAEVAPEPVALEAAPVPAAATETPASPELSVETPEPPPIPVENIPVIEPVAPVSADPFPPAASSAAPAPIVDPAPAEAAAAPTPPPAPAAEPAPAPIEPPPAAPERPARKRATRRSEPEPGTDLLLDLGHDGLTTNSSDESQEPPADAIEHVISSDGATRLIATAYIGIGNRLFIRGDGPGLSWEKGVPLLFVSIGKWRWETSDATTPVAYKLYKNDELECTALGRLTLDPGHQQEVTAKF